MQSKSWISLVLFFALFITFSCDKDNEEIALTEEEQSAYEAELSTESYFDVVESITTSAVQYADANAGGRLAENSDPELVCATIELLPDNNKIVVDFGDGCTGPDEKVRKGKVIIEYVGDWLTQGGLVTTILQDFYVDDIKVEGTRAVTTTGFQNMTLTQSVQISGGKVTWPDGTFITRKSTRTHRLIFGDQLSDIVLEVEGTAEGTTRTGIEYTSMTVEPLVFKAECFGHSMYVPASGITAITVTDLPQITVNYGDGACDGKLTIEMQRGKKEVTL